MAQEYCSHPCESRDGGVDDVGFSKKSHFLSIPSR